MNNSVVINIVRFVGLILAQILIFNNFQMWGYINPLPYVLFILVYPFINNRTLFIVVSFLLGLTMDMFDNSGGVHAAACLVMGYTRPAVLRFAFGVSYEYNTIKLSNVTFYERSLYIAILVIIHHIVLFSLEVFNISSILYILQKALLSSIFTIVVCLMLSVLFSTRKK